MKGKKVLVTGSGGFVGSHLVENLIEQGAQVTALVHYNSQKSTACLKYISGSRDLRVVFGDINDPFFCLDLVKDQEFIFHLGGQISVPYSFLAPKIFFDTNVLGTINLLEAAKNSTIKRFIYGSSSEVYGTILKKPVDEDYPLNAQSPYAASKIGAEQAVISYFFSFGLPVTIIRPFNTYGPHQSTRAVIPSIITQILSSSSKKIKLGSLTTARDFVYVKDVAKAYIKLAMLNTSVGKIINVGTGRSENLLTLCQIIMDLTNIKKQIVIDKSRARPEKSEILDQFSNNAKLKKLTGWEPKTALEDGLTETVQWFRKNISNFDSDKYQI